MLLHGKFTVETETIEQHVAKWNSWEQRAEQHVATGNSEEQGIEQHVAAGNSEEQGTVGTENRTCCNTEKLAIENIATCWEQLRTENRATCCCTEQLGTENR
jgi:hypothetical protein